MPEASLFPPEEVRAIMNEVAGLLRDKGESVSVAETLYTLESRIAFAGWTKDNIKSYNGPTPDLVAICESGTAGPTASGKTPNRQPGYVALAVSTDKGNFTRELFDLGSDREANMVKFAAEALRLLRDVIKGDAKL